MTEIRPRRSVLSLPGSNPQALEAARTLPVDAVLLDLEQTVPPEAKDAARKTVAAAVTGRPYGHREVVVRINALDSAHGEADLAAIAAAGPDAILVPKVSGPDALVAVGARLRRLGAAPALRIWAMIESPLAVLQVGAIASAARDVDTRLSCLVVGTDDLAAATRIRRGVPGRPALMPLLMSVVAAARAYEIDVIDGVFEATADEAGFRAEAEQARDGGFDGKVLIDPAQIAAANAVFGPGPDAVAQARAAIAAFAAPAARERGTAAFRGRTIDRSHADEAHRIVALADAIAARRP
ncbi:CoA ester lyase [Methylobacterium sp. J-059]|uniref:HpcH/HpaI aldolase/citrate lyase family protein n=1 Tax=Methylobacterium sp. J-059 TaxID=2836643 RepID=UPI001FBA8183|nr:CoA ester lyase [Methylobacterium sp. J-059]MCJ2040141.1 CoA ester lyase [Methylobacterium sp. J-059]